MRVTFLTVFLTLFGLCSRPVPEQLQSPINLNHALSLVDSITVNNEQLYFIYIYADAPDYQPVVADQEGISCVDDVGRFMEVLETEICRYNRKDLLPIALGMTRFLLYMSRDDGLWYNFIHANGQINTAYRTSTAEFQWWAVRGLRGLAAAYRILKQYPADPNLKMKVVDRIHSMDTHLDENLQKYPQTTTTEFGERPLWLIKNAPDLNSELLLVLTGLQRTGDFSYIDEIKMIADGLIGFQYRNENSPLDGMYFCWQNIWHNWGNNQSKALLEAYQITKDKRYLTSVRRWADHFVPFLIKNDMAWEITVTDNDNYQVTDFPQIAYGIHAMYSGLKRLSGITGDKQYVDEAEKVFAWFKGQNPAGVNMYDPNTGRCYDGINSQREVNFNSGAESTIECLLAIQDRERF